MKAYCVVWTSLDEGESYVKGAMFEATADDMFLDLSGYPSDNITELQVLTLGFAETWGIQRKASFV